jgi:hypothetical protein
MKAITLARFSADPNHLPKLRSHGWVRPQQVSRRPEFHQNLDPISSPEKSQWDFPSTTDRP